MLNDFRKKTSWCVITGAPCSGKTTLLKQLDNLGYHCSYESARIYIEDRLAKGETIEQIRADEAVFQRSLIDEKLRIERSMPTDKLIFFDRAMPDSIAYYRLAGLDPKEVLPYCTDFLYKKVFIFDQLPFEKDNARTEDQETRNFLDHWFEKDYAALGYDVIRVPVMSLEKRIEFVLREVGEV